MTDVFELISDQAQSLKFARNDLLDRLDRARRDVQRIWRGDQRKWQRLTRDASRLTDRATEPMLDAAVAVASFVDDVRTQMRRLVRRL